MAAPAQAAFLTYAFRDAKGNVSRMRFLIGAATIAAIDTAYIAGTTLLAAASNAAVRQVNLTDRVTRVYGTQATYGSVEDKAQLTFLSVPTGAIHRFQLPAPKSVGFLTDQETVNSGETNMAALIAWITANVYGETDDTAPVTFAGGIRTRVKMQRKVNIFTLNPAETGPAE